MGTGAWAMVVALMLGAAAMVFVVAAMVRSIQNERAATRSVWREFSLGLALMILFFVTWIAHGIVEWQAYTDEQRAQGEATAAGDFVAQFAQATLENWQSEFLQLFAFVSLAALYIHKGSAESKDGEERLESSLRRIEEHLGTLPASAPRAAGNHWRLPDTPLETDDAAG
jgi:hypothetical protein